jgi:hypothetical protein
MKTLLIGTALMVGGRFLIPGHDLSWAGTYEAVAHIWVGVLLTVAFRPGRSATSRGEGMSLREGATRWLAGGLLVATSVFEVVMYLRRTS